jgi:hypothetical protein
MIERRAAVLVADEVLFALNGKAYLQGIYTGDITIVGNAMPLPQLIFMFIVETGITKPFNSLVLQAIVPGNPPAKLVVPPELQAVHPVAGRDRIIIRFPLVVPMPVLRPGRIDARVLHEDGEIEVGAPWIISVGQLAVPTAPTAKN